MFRYEKKYLLSPAEEAYLKNHLDALMFRDVHSDELNKYNIRSLYFDDYADSAYNDNAAGVDPRTKYRIRIYNSNPDVIHLECKMKQGGKIKKERALVSREFCELLLRDEGEKIEFPTDDPLVNRFMVLYHTAMLRPKIIVEYEREPYVYPDGDVRITFDRNISFSSETERFFDPDIFLQPLLSSGKELLEVKYTEFMPEFIHRELEIKKMQQCTFSKFYLCETNRRIGGVIR